jgi:hypothetical protein
MNTSGGTNAPSARRQRISSSAPAGLPSWSTCSCRCIASSPFSSASGQVALQRQLAARPRPASSSRTGPRRCARGLGVVHGGVGLAQQVVRALSACGGSSATPMLAEACTLAVDVDRLGQRRAHLVRAAQRRACGGGAIVVQPVPSAARRIRRRRCAPPCRALRTTRRQARGRVRSSASPVAWPRASFTFLKLSRSMNSTAPRPRPASWPGPPWRRALHQQAPVRQAGQDVVEGQAVDRVGRLAALGDVAPDHDPVAGARLRRRRAPSPSRPSRARRPWCSSPVPPRRLVARHGVDDARRPSGSVSGPCSTRMLRPMMSPRV